MQICQLFLLRFKLREQRIQLITPLQLAHDALNNVAAGRDLTATTTQRINALRSTLRLADLRYKAGYSPYLEVLNAQRDLAQAESGLIDIQRSQLNAGVSLYKAVGGGWDAATVVGQAAKP